MDNPGAQIESASDGSNAGLPFSPKQFLKMRRPERFSDSSTSTDPALDRAMLEYHLHTLTSRSEETPFEEFAKALLQRTVCPNLLPHTGPSGGGDSKVDSETYPVAPSLALSWHVGEPERAAKERWAFAFSAKEDWRPKVRSDIAKIVATKRGYSKAFFVSNQSIRDRVRAAVEDELKTEHGIDLRIFDRTWLLDQVFDNKLEALAIDRLRIKTELRHEVRKGPRDTEREQEFDAVETEIVKAIQEGRQSPALVDKGLLSADLARRMERPRHQIDGLYARAVRMAAEYGTPHQQLRCAYERAWTSYWWHEDYGAFLQQYEDFASQAQGSQNPYELELWSNLFSCLYMIARSPAYAGRVDSKPKAELLLASLETVAQQDDRPSASLHAYSLAIQLSLLTAEPGAHDDLLSRLANTVQKAEGLIGYPFEPLSQIVTELGAVFGELPGYQRLFEEMLTASTRRVGDVSAARMMLRRGTQQLNTGRAYDAIRMFGRVMGRLYKHESREDAIRALYLCSHAYEQVGLLWAARGTALAAANIVTNDFWTYENLTPQQAACYNRIKWIELRLGRLGPTIAWHELDRVIRAALIERGYTAAWLAQDDVFDPILGMLLLKADLDTLSDLTRLPDALDSVDLPLSRFALLFALGHEEEVPPELKDTASGERDLIDFVKMWRDQPAKDELPPAPKIDLTQTVRMASTIAGCSLEVVYRNESPCIELGESLLACLESLLATAMIDGVVAREPSLKIKISTGDFAEPPFAFDTEDIDGAPAIDIRCRPSSPHNLSIDEQIKMKERLFEVAAHILGRVYLINDAATLLTKLFRDDLASERAMDFTTSFVVVGNVLGHDAKTNLDRWIDRKATDYPLLRTVVWDKADRETISSQAHRAGLTPAAAGDEMPDGLGDLNQVSHRQIQTVSMIREALWNEAGWHGLVFAGSDDPSVRPILALLFESADAGMKIFEGWHDEIGDVDEDDTLRISILRHIRVESPHWYRVVIGNDPASSLFTDATKRVVMISRMHTMTPESGENLDRFLAAYEKAGGYFLCQAVMAGGNQLQLVAKNAICKKRIIVREAWEVGPHDPECVAIWSDDNPIIPEGVEDPPVVKTLERITKTK